MITGRSRAVGVPEAAAGRDPIPHQPFELGQVGMCALLGTGPQQGAVDADVEDPSGSGHESDFAELLLECSKHLLSDPRRAEHPAALRAVLNL